MSPREVAVLRRLTQFAVLEAPSSTTSLCAGCANLQGPNDDGTARCSAFAVIPAAIWNGEADHRTSLEGDGGVTFVALGAYGQAVERAFAARAATLAEAEIEETPADEREPIPEEDLRPERRDDVSAEAAVDAPPEEWHALLVVEGTPTGDGRFIEEGALTWPDFTVGALLPIERQLESPEMGGHANSVHVAQITRMERQANEVHAWGHYLDDDPESDGAQFAADLREAGRMAISVDMDDADVEVVWPEEDEEGDGEIILFAEPEQVRFTRARVIGATVVRFPAFQEAFIEPIEVEEAIEEAEEDEAALIASAAPAEPPSAWFDDPRLDRPTPLTVMDDGRIIGHLATWGTCHTSFQGACITPPMEPDYGYFTTGEVLTAEGTRVPVGQITLGTGHAGLSLNHSAAARHYDDTGSAVANVAVGRDAHGIWMAGALCPQVTPTQVRALRASAPSGDWRRIAGSLRLVAVLSVNVPGYPIPRTASHVASGAQTALVAAGLVLERSASTQVGRGRLRNAWGRTADRIAADVGRDRRGRANAAASRVRVTEFAGNCGSCGGNRSQAPLSEQRAAARAGRSARTASAAPMPRYQVTDPDGSVNVYPTLFDARRAQKASRGKMKVI